MYWWLLCDPLVEIVWCVIVRKEDTNTCVEFPHTAMKLILLQILCLIQKNIAVIKGKETLLRSSIVPVQLQNRSLSVADRLHYSGITEGIFIFIWKENMKNKKVKEK